MADAADRMFDNLPAVFRRRDDHGDAARLLGALAGYFFGDPEREGAWLGLERTLEAIPTLFSPLGESQDGALPSRTPDRFLGWLADWLAFTPHPHFAPERLRRILDGIVPMYGYRGTKRYLFRLLELCFEDEVVVVDVDDRPRVGFTVGQSSIGIDTRLAVHRPFFFRVVVESPEAPRHELDRLRHRLWAVIDSAKPAHTAYELEWRTRTRGMARAGEPSA